MIFNSDASEFDDVVTHFLENKYAKQLKKWDNDEEGSHDSYLKFLFTKRRQFYLKLIRKQDEMK